MGISAPGGGLRTVDLHVVLRFSAGGDAVAHGTVHIHDGTSSTFLIGESLPQASCADSDGDGIAGISALELAGRNPRSGDEILVAFTLGDQDLDERGEYEVEVRVGDLAGEATLAFLPLPAGPPAGPAR